MLARGHLLWCVLACVSHLVDGLPLLKPVAAGDHDILSRDAVEARAKGFGNGMPLRIMPLGASITFGYGSTDGNGYRKDLRDQLEAYGNKINMVGANPGGKMKDNESEGWKSYTVDMVHEKADKSVPEFKPNLILINAGTNDCFQNKDLSKAGDRVASMLNDLYRESPRATVILSTLIVNRNEEIAKRVKDFNTQLRRVATWFQIMGKRLVLVDMQGSEGPKLEDLIEDGTHPSDGGYKKMAKVWFEGIKEADRMHFLREAEAVKGLNPDGAA
ncbi:hypothetical protein AAE478_007167 [Parahypoxylon ruwenzoriense]